MSADWSPLPPEGREHNPPGDTEHEAAASMVSQRLTFGRRRGELVMDQKVEDSGLRRKTPTGRSAIVWRVVQ